MAHEAGKRYRLEAEFVQTDMGRAVVLGLKELNAGGDRTNHWEIKFIPDRVYGREDVGSALLKMRDKLDALDVQAEIINFFIELVRR